MRPLAAALLFAALLGGCLEHLPADLPAARLGSTTDVPVGPASGRAYSVHFFDWRRFGDDTTAAAIANAKKLRPEEDLINATVNRKVLCFPACQWPIVTWSETSVEGTLVRYKRLPDWTKPEAPETQKLAVGQRPPAEALIDRLMHIYVQDPPQAAQFFASLDNGSRDETVRYVLAVKGLTSASGWTFRILKGTPAAEKKFLAWFVVAYTTYQPLDE